MIIQIIQTVALKYRNFSDREDWQASKSLRIMKLIGEVCQGRGKVLCC